MTQPLPSLADAARRAGIGALVFCVGKGLLFVSPYLCMVTGSRWLKDFPGMALNVVVNRQCIEQI